MDALENTLNLPRAAREPLLDVDLSARYGKREVLRNVQFNLRRGEVLGLVGSSGAGKSTLVNSLLGLLHWSGGSAEGRIDFAGQNLLDLSESQLRQIRGRLIALIPQSPLASLNPALRLLQHFEEAWKAHHARAVRLDRDALSTLMRSVQLPADEEFLRRRPSQISVGQAQRILIVTALLHRPGLLVADEPTSALDPITQAEIIQLLSRVARNGDTAMLFISHDLLSVFQLSDRIAILHEGQIVECSTTRELLTSPQHPHTKALLAALPVEPQYLLEVSSRQFSPELKSIGDCQKRQPLSRQSRSGTSLTPAIT